ncbi:calcium-dependent protein kinase 32-like [Carex rostrata]
MEHLPEHNHIIQLLGAYEDHHKVYLVMELCEGGELYDRIVNMNFCSESDVATAFKDIIQAVKVCHENGIMHRDIKPENLLYTSKEKTARLKVIDFGLSTFFTPGQRFGEVVGTYCYMAPEVLMGDYGKEVDIWSAGVILYILFCGETPFSGETDEEIKLAVRKGEIDERKLNSHEISEDAKDLVRGMLNLDPKKRLTVQQILGFGYPLDKLVGLIRVGCLYNTKASLAGKNGETQLRPRKEGQIKEE